MEHDSLIFSFFLIFTGAAMLSTVALFLKQPLLIAYILLGVILGPHGLGYVAEANLLTDIAEFGIIFLLFLLGLDMQPSKMFVTLKKTFLVTLASSLAFFLLGFGTGFLFDFTLTEAVVMGFAMVVSSTIIGIKLLPTTVLHQKHMGELMVGILLLQDFIAIFILAFLDSGSLTETSALRALLAFPLLLAVAYGTTRFLLVPLVAVSIISGVHFSARHWLVSWPGGTGLGVGAVCRDRRLCGGNFTGDKSHFPVYLSQPEAIAGFLPDSVFLFPGRAVRHLDAE